MKKIEKIRYAIRNNPLLIGSLMKDTSIKKGLIYSELKKSLPCRIGIEFETGGSFREGFCKKYNVGNIPNTDKIITDYYKVLSIKCDHLYSSSATDTIMESRISLSDFRQLKGLYIFLQDIKEFCTLHEGGGIHIHVDMSSYTIEDCKLREVKNYINNRLDEVAAIFPPYTGKYNKKRVGVHEKSTWVNISRLNTLEFRIAPLTFDYNTLITWIIKLIKFRNSVIHYCRLRLDYAKYVESRLPSKDAIEELLNTRSELLDMYSDTNEYITNYIRGNYWALNRQFGLNLE